MKIQKSAEDYLETILMLNLRKGVAHAVDIAAERDFSKPSVSVAMKNLRENGYINVDEDNAITLTESGKKIAEAVWERHQILRQWLISLGVPADQAEKDACKMEHTISEESFTAIKKYVQAIEQLQQDCNIHKKERKE